MNSNNMGNIFWLASYPKSGNTWMRAFIASLRKETPETLDINEIQTGNIASSRQWIQQAYDFDINELSHDEVDQLRPEAYNWLSQNMTSPEYHKIHDAYTFLKNGTPIIPSAATRGVLYIVRNPLDVAVSFSHHSGISIDQSIAKMAKVDSSFCGHTTRLNIQLRQRLLTWSEHISSWRDRSSLRLKLVRYEDMVTNPIPTFKDVAHFLELPSSENAVGDALESCKFENLKAQESKSIFREKPMNAVCFFRKGLVGDWQNSLTGQQVDRIINDHSKAMRTLGYLDDKKSRRLSFFRIPTLCH